MPRWARGEAEIERLIGRGELEQVAGAAADGRSLLEQARRTATTAAGLVCSDPYSAYVLPMTLRGSPALPCSRSKACAPRPAAAITRSNKRPGLSSETDSGRSGFCGVAATNWNTLTFPQIQPPQKKPGRQPRQRSDLSPP